MFNQVYSSGCFYRKLAKIMQALFALIFLLSLIGLQTSQPVAAEPVTPDISVSAQSGSPIYAVNMETFLDGENELSKINAPIDNSNDSDQDCSCNENKTDKKGKKVKIIKNTKRNLYLRLKDKKHIFLPELYYYFNKYDDTEFVLMHFSDRYDKETVISTINNVRLKYPNVYGAI